MMGVADQEKQLGCEYFVRLVSTVADDLQTILENIEAKLENGL